MILLRGRAEDDVHVEIEHAVIDDEHHYAALSYVWGDAKNNLHPVTIDGRSVHWATYNLWQALRRIRAGDEDRVLWCDAICINQLDPEEKSIQIGYMSNIFPAANRVLCWLGDDDGIVGMAFAVLQQWSKASGEGEDKDNLKLRLAENIKKQIVEGGKEQEAVSALFTRPWWRRAWTLQEVCVDSTKPPFLLCGQHELSWVTLYTACFAMLTTLTQDERVVAFGRTIGHVLSMLQFSLEDKNRVSLSKLIPRVASREATDPKDKIFSLLGIAAPQTLGYPLANYNMTVDQVCISYTRAIIQVERKLDILLWVGSNKPGHNLPSWCIKIDNLRGDRILVGSGKPKLNGAEYNFNATPGKCPLVDTPIKSTDAILALYGIPIDVVVRTHPLGSLRAYLSKEPLTWWDVLMRVREFGKQQALPKVYGPTGRSIVNAILRTLSADNFYLSSQGSYWLQHGASYISYQRHFLGDCAEDDVRFGAQRSVMSKEMFRDFVVENFRFQTPHERNSPGCGTAAIAIQHDPYIPTAWLDRTITAHLFESFDLSFDDRCFFVTQKGYIGLGPTTCRPGDHICLLFGSPLPFMLRPVRTRVGTAYQLLDEVYLEGIMHGEGMSEYEANLAAHGGEAASDGLTRYCLI